MFDFYSGFYSQIGVDTKLARSLIYIAVPQSLLWVHSMSLHWDALFYIDSSLDSRECIPESLQQPDTTSPELDSCFSGWLEAHCQELSCRHVLQLCWCSCAHLLPKAWRAPSPPRHIPAEATRAPGEEGIGGVSQPPFLKLSPALGCGLGFTPVLSRANLPCAGCCAWQPQPPSPLLCDHNHRLSVDASREERTGPSLHNFFISAAWSHN